MNIHGYKQSMKRMAKILKKLTRTRKSEEENFSRIKRLREAKSDCSRKIRELKAERDKKK